MDRGHELEQLRRSLAMLSPEAAGLTRAQAMALVVFAFWDELVVDASASASVRSGTGGVSPNRFIVFEWVFVEFLDYRSA